VYKEDGTQIVRPTKNVLYSMLGFFSSLNDATTKLTNHDLKQAKLYLICIKNCTTNKKHNNLKLRCWF